MRYPMSVCCWMVGRQGLERGGEGVGRYCIYTEETMWHLYINTLPFIQQHTGIYTTTTHWHLYNNTLAFIQMENSGVGRIRSLTKTTLSVGIIVILTDNVNSTKKIINSDQPWLAHRNFQCVRVMSVFRHFFPTFHGTGP